MSGAVRTIGQMLAAGPQERAAIRAPERASLTYAALAALVANKSGAIVGAGVGKGDAVAIVLPNGPEAATAFLAVANCAVAAPLNPSYKQDEFRFYMEDLGAKLLICADPEGPAAQAAAGLNIPFAVITSGVDHAAGDFDIDLPDAPPCPLTQAGESDIALVLHTSGTTSRPKIVPLSHRNVTASARNIAASLALTQDDACLNIMPLFHIHGLIAAVLASLRAGGSVCCTPGFNALKVFSWFEAEKPSWYTAVPTMHQAIVARAARNPDVVAGMKLRLIRSSSSSLPPQVMAEVEAMFGCAVVEAYGMTEAAHQMTSNPIEMGMQKPGAVGKAAGPKVAIYANDAISDAADVTGEIVINGENVTAGYQANEKANAESFLPDAGGDGVWFRTGDQGRFDGDGYLYITGRLKEIINRGGEKISPREVDEVLMDHNAVEQAVTFAVPHPQLGEDVGAAVVLKEGQSAEAQDIRSFAAERLAAFKVPRTVLILEEIPKGPTGKLQRIGLAEKLGLGG